MSGKTPTDEYVRNVYAQAPVERCEHANQTSDYAADQFDLWLAEVRATALNRMADELESHVSGHSHENGQIIAGRHIIARIREAALSTAKEATT